MLSVENGGQRWGGDVLKALCTFLVVCIYCSPITKGGYLNAVYRIAVPCFFMITGFFFKSMYQSGKIER